MMEKADFLLEIGCEDLPTVALSRLLLILERKFEELLGSYRLLLFKKSITMGTARRLVLIQRELSLKSIKLMEPKFGPSEAAGKDSDGNWTEAAKGFASNHGIDVNQLFISENDKNQRAWSCNYEYPILESIAVLPELLKALLEWLSKEYQRTMRWGSGDFAFPRPIRWIVALLGEQVIDLEIAGVRSGNQSFGHRFLAPEPFIVTSVDQYLSELAQRSVVLDGAERRKRIREQGDRLAAERHARIVWDEDLLGVVADQVEYPQTLIGEFPPEYAELPRALISATLTGYQKYFPLEDASGKLLPCFLAIYDSSPAAEANVRHGNQSAVSARLADAKFFYDHDLATGLAAMREHLAGRGYLPGAGTVLDKSERLIHITEALADAVEQSNPGIVVDREVLKQAAEYCKADLESAVVGEKEFAHLQGEMGFHYALAEKLNSITALAIREHYNPRNAGDPPAATTEGRIVALADKLDHLAALASIGKLPRGGDDPFGARRAAVGVIINTLGLSEAEIAARKPHFGYKLDLDVLYAVADILGTKENIAPDAIKFTVDRFINLMDEYCLIRKDFLLGLVGRHGNDLAGCYQRILLVDEALRTLPAWQPLAEAAKRCRNILDAAERDGISIGGFNPTRFELAEEKELATVLGEVTGSLPPAEQIGTELIHFEVLSRLRDPLHEFFAKVFVMVEDTAVRDNRLGLLKAVYDLLGNIMDFSKIEIVTKTK